MGTNEIELEQQLKKAGNLLLDPPSFVDELLNLLDKVEHLLFLVEQAPSTLMQDALLPVMKALISTSLMRHKNVDVRVSVTSCISELTRITAPDAPYNDVQMKEILQMTVAAFDELSRVTSRGYMKSISIIDTVAKVRSFLLMLDLELNELIVKMFHDFLEIIRSNHPPTVFSAMETIMTFLIDESEDISPELLSPLLASIRKENQSVSPAAWKLAERVVTNCNAKIKPFVKGVVQSLGTSFNDYAPIVASLYVDDSGISNQETVNFSRESLMSMGPPVEGIPRSVAGDRTISTRNADTIANVDSDKTMEHSLAPCTKTEMLGDSEPKVNHNDVPGTVSRKQRWKPNSWMNPEEGYDHYWISSGRKTGKLPHERRFPDNETNDSREVVLSLPCSSLKKRKSFTKGTMESVDAFFVSQKEIIERDQLEKNTSIVNQNSDSLLLSESTQVKDHEISLVKQSVSLMKQYKQKSRPEEIKQKHVRKKLMGYSPGANVPELSGDKKTKSSKDGIETPITVQRRKRTPRKEVALETPELGEELIGSKIRVWWPLDNMFYAGVVGSYDPIKKKHKVVYVDGDKEVLNLKKERWELIEVDVSPNEGEETDHPKPGAMSDKLHNGKRKAKSDLRKHSKVDSSIKRRGGTSASKPKGKSSRIPTNGVTCNKPIILDERMTDAPIPDSEPDDDSDGSPEGSNEFCIVARADRDAKKW